MTKVYLGQKVRVIKAEHKPELVGRVLYLDDVVENAHMGCYFVDGNPNGDGDTANENDDYGWVEQIQVVSGPMIRRERYFDNDGMRKRFMRADVLPYELEPYVVLKDFEANGEAAPAHDPVDMVNHPPHYKFDNGVEVIDLTEQLSFNLGNAVKYAARAGRKSPNPIEDLRKSKWYVEREITRLERMEN